MERNPAGPARAGRRAGRINCPFSFKLLAPPRPGGVTTVPGHWQCHWQLSSRLRSRWLGPLLLVTVTVTVTSTSDWRPLAAVTVTQGQSESG